MIKIERKKYYPIGDGVSDFTYSQVKDACESLACDFGEEMELDEAIDETSDSFTPIYYSQLYGSCRDIADYAEQAVEEGLYCLPSNDPYSSGKKQKPFRLHELLQMGWYLYLRDCLSNNLKRVMFNWLVSIANADPRIDPAAQEAVEEGIEAIVSDVGNNTDRTFGWYREEYLSFLMDNILIKEE